MTIGIDKKISARKKAHTIVELSLKPIFITQPIIEFVVFIKLELNFRVTAANAVAIR